MSLKDILVHIEPVSSGNSAGLARLALAARLAASHGARLTGIYVRPVIDIPPLAQTVAGTSLTQIIQRSADAAAAEARAVFDSQLADSGADHRWLEVTGNPADVLSHHLHTTDLAVIGSSDGDQPASRRLSGQLVLSSGVPVLVVPDSMVPDAGAITTPARRVLVAWNNSRESVRAVRDALPVLRAADQVEILMILARSIDHNRSAPGVALTAHLARHGVNAEVKVIAFNETQGVSGQVLARADALSADLIVMGGFGRSWLREAMIGSTTGTLMTRSPIPLMVSR